MPKKGIGWRVLSKRLVPRLPGVASFRGGFLKPREAVIDAYYRGTVPPKQTLELSIAKQKITVKVRPHRLPTPRSQPPAAFAIAGVSFTGVHPGARIAIPLGGSSYELGAICALLAPQADAGAPTHLLTCGHIFRPGSSKTKVRGGDAISECDIGILDTNLLDESSDPRDVALVTLTTDGVNLAIRQNQPGPHLDDYFDPNAIFGLDCRTWRPTTVGYANSTTADDVTNVHLKAPLWPNGIDLVEVIPTVSVVSRQGDSGTILATRDRQACAIGSCSGNDGSSSFFEPIGRALDELSAGLTVWRN